MGLSRRLRPLCGLAAVTLLGARAQAATAPPEAVEVVDDAHRFRLARPGPEWEVLDAESAGALAAGALAGAIRSKAVGLVFLEGPVEGDLAAGAKTVVESLAAKALLPPEYTHVGFRGRPAVRVVVLASLEGAMIRFEHLFFGHGGYLFRLSAWGPPSAATEETAASFQNAFEPLPGAVRPVAAAAPAARAGAGWRSAGGTYENARLGLRVRLPEGWKVFAGEALWRIDPDLEVAFEDERGLTSVLLYVDRVAGKGARTLAARITATGITGAGTMAADRVELRFGAERIAFRTWIPAPEDDEAKTEDEMDHLFAAARLGKHLIRIWIGCSRTDTEACARRAAPLLEAVEALAPAETKMLAATLGTSGEPSATIGLDFSLRRGVYRNFLWGVTWTTPAGTWDVFPGDAARAAGGSPETLLVVREPTVGFTGALLGRWREDRSLDGRHAADVADMSAWLDVKAPADKPRGRDLGGAPARITRLSGPRPADAVPVYLTVATVRLGDADFLVLLTETDAASSKRAATAALDALRFFDARGLPATELGLGRYADHRVGFEFDSRELGMMRAEPSADRPSANVRWTLGGLGAAIVAIDVAPDLEPERVARVLHGRTVLALSKIAGAAPMHGVLTLAGHDALHEYWARDGLRVDLLTVVVDGIVYQITVHTSDATEEAALAMIGRFRLAD